jgi:hypothetical protein
VLRDAGAASDEAAVVDCTATAIGTGQMSETYRVALEWEDARRAGPASIVVKLAAADAMSRTTGIGLGIYEREIRFYGEVAPRIGGPIAACHLAVYDAEEGWFTLVIEDTAPSAQGDQIAGCSVEDARLAIHELARLHAPVWDDQELECAEWLNQPSVVDQAIVAGLLTGFLERYEERIEAEHRAMVERFVARFDAWNADRRRPFSIVHGDYRLDNLLFGKPGSPRPLTVVDWQTVSWGQPLLDASYFLGAGLSVEDRRAHEEALLREYHEALRTLGVGDFEWERCWEEYRRQAFHGVLMSVIAPMLVVRTERGDDMFMTSLARYSQQVLDLDAEDLLPG